MKTLIHQRRLIQAVSELLNREQRSVVKYKRKMISYPAESEKSFFSLAILPASTRYFRTPDLIDEVANNSDSKNL